MKGAPSAPFISELGGSMKMFHCRYASRLCCTVVAVLVLLVLSSTSHASDVRHIWQSRDQFVALERQDVPPSGTVAINNHPVQLSPDRLAAMLASIEFSSEEGSKPEQLITNESLEVLVPQLVQGFRRAAPGEDVTFAIIGLHKSMLGFAKSAKVTTGRAFYQGGRLNVIFGLVRKEFNEREDRRLSPFTPGTRQKAPQDGWMLLAQPGRNGFTLSRKDWVTFSDEWRAAVARTPVSEQIVPSVPTTPARSDKQDKDTRSPVERLTTLNELKGKGLISEEEYQGKRLQILNGL